MKKSAAKHSTVQITEIRILPAFAIARLGSSPHPVDAYYHVNPKDHVSSRRIRPMDTLEIDPRTGAVHLKQKQSGIQFRDTDGNVRPVAPFFEIWARPTDENFLVPLDLDLLKKARLTPRSVRWSVQVGNWKAFRRTRDPKDRIDAIIRPFNDHTIKRLKGRCKHFFRGKSIPLGSVRYIRPTAEFPQIRLRFTPASGKVYGSSTIPEGPDGILAGKVYDTKRGKWKGYRDPDDVKKDNVLDLRRTTDPQFTYADDGTGKSLGYLDDECDGFIHAELRIKKRLISAYARVVVGPPTFVPDCMPIRTIYDELEQAALGPEADRSVSGGQKLQEEVREIVLRALESVRLTNTAQMNKALREPGGGMARMDNNDFGRALEPISEPSLMDMLAIQTRHERLLVALDSGSLAWFARVLRKYGQVGDLSDEGRRRMPALMRGSDARHLALTRLQVSRVRAAAEPAPDKRQRRGRR